MPSSADKDAAPSRAANEIMTRSKAREARNKPPFRSERLNNRWREKQETLSGLQKEWSDKIAAAKDLFSRKRLAPLTSGQKAQIDALIIGSRDDMPVSVQNTTETSPQQGQARPVAAKPDRSPKTQSSRFRGSRKLPMDGLRSARNYGTTSDALEEGTRATKIKQQEYVPSSSKLGGKYDLRSHVGMLRKNRK